MITDKKNKHILMIEIKLYCWIRECNVPEVSIIERKKKIISMIIWLEEGFWLVFSAAFCIWCDSWKWYMEYVYKIFYSFLLAEMILWNFNGNIVYCAIFKWKFEYTNWRRKEAAIALDKYFYFGKFSVFCGRKSPKNTVNSLSKYLKIFTTFW